MRLALVEGNAVSTTKHPSMVGYKLLLVQPLDARGKVAPDDDPLLVVDTIGAGHGMKVVISNDGRAARELVGDTTSPVRWTVIGISDD
ncbi:MAG: EutN/CcmL family microcompartment protein [Acidobacteriota bacterium]